MNTFIIYSREKKNICENVKWWKNIRREKIIQTNNIHKPQTIEGVAKWFVLNLFFFLFSCWYYYYFHHFLLILWKKIWFLFVQHKPRNEELKTLLLPSFDKFWSFSIQYKVLWDHIYISIIISTICVNRERNYCYYYINNEDLGTIRK